MHRLEGTCLARHRGPLGRGNRSTPPAPTRRSPCATARSSPRSEAGSVACFPPPHQYLSRATRPTTSRPPGPAGTTAGLTKSVRVRHPPGPQTGGGEFVPWFNAPPGTEQRLGVFYLLSRGRAEDALDEALRLHPRRPLPDAARARTFTSHWHMAVAVAAMESRRRARADDPDFVNDVQGDGRQHRPPRRVPRRRPSQRPRPAPPARDGGDVRRVPPALRRHAPAHPRRGGQRLPRHPRARQASRPLDVPLPPARLLDHEARARTSRSSRTTRSTARSTTSATAATCSACSKREHGLAWTAHPRIKASSWTPDIFRDEDFFRSDHWLGAAWKAMPADLSRPSSASACSTCSTTWPTGASKKYVPGEVDVFKIDHTHELYGHMNVNYLRLDRAAAVRRGLAAGARRPPRAAGSSSPPARS